MYLFLWSNVEIGIKDLNYCSDRSSLVFSSVLNVWRNFFSCFLNQFSISSLRFFPGLKTQREEIRFRYCLHSWHETRIWKFYYYHGCWFITSCKYYFEDSMPHLKPTRMLGRSYMNSAVAHNWLSHNMNNSLASLTI